MIGVAVLDFGGPQSEDELVPFLTNLLTDVLPGPAMVKGIAAPRIARSRARTVGPHYASIGWSPLVPTHRRQVEALRAALATQDGATEAPPLASGMMFTAPTMDEAVASLRTQGVDRIVALPMFPHHSIATTQAAFSFFHDALVRAGWGEVPVRWIPAYPEHPSYVEALANTIRAGVAATPGDPADPVHLLFTPHGLPVSWVTDRGDPYPDQIRASVRAAIRLLGWTGPYHVGWQSRVGPVRWLTPSTPDALDAIAAAGGKRVCMVPISFASEHIETLYEIDVEYRAHAEQRGITGFGRAPALGVEPAFVDCLADLVRTGIASFGRYECVRCLMPKDDAHRRRPSCPNCRFKTPAYLREGRA
ncbi:MAG: ferrochelatase [Myxococcota bacterium]